jgi:hypothetical protein
MPEFNTYTAVVVHLNNEGRTTVETNHAVGKFVEGRIALGDKLTAVVEGIDPQLDDPRTRSFYSQCLKVVQVFPTLDEAKVAGSSWRAIRDAAYAHGREESTTTPSKPATARQKADKAVEVLTDAQFKALVKAEVKRRGITL